MKSITILSLLSIFATDVSARVGCPRIYQPVLCGNLQLEFGNMCLALQTGFFAESDCVLKETHDGCTYEYDPVVCGPSNEHFDNMCLAEQGGFVENECTKDADVIICPAVYDPVICPTENGKEIFSNSCIAKKQGAVDDEGDCTCSEYEDIMHHMTSFFGKHNCDLFIDHDWNDMFYTCGFYDSTPSQHDVTSATFIVYGIDHPIPESLTVFKDSGSSLTQEVFFANECEDLQITKQLLQN